MYLLTFFYHLRSLSVFISVEPWYLRLLQANNKDNFNQYKNAIGRQFGFCTQIQVPKDFSTKIFAISPLNAASQVWFTTILIANSAKPLFQKNHISASKYPSITVRLCIIHGGKFEQSYLQFWCKKCPNNCM